MAITLSLSKGKKTAEDLTRGIDTSFKQVRYLDKEIAKTMSFYTSPY